MEVLNMGEPEEGMLGKGGAKESCATNKAVNGCPAILIKLAQSEFERACVQEFIEIEEDLGAKFTSIKTELKWIKYIVLTVLVGIVLDVIKNIIIK